MIPLKLHIKNFLSYGSDVQTIEFGAYPLICLSGKNGHGKSALLDAITWALWGQARKIAGSVKADQGLMRLGQTHMMVILDFALGNQTYRVRREFGIIRGKPHAQLEFGIVHSDSTLIPLTDKTIRATQEKIEQTIHIDFESFVNSAFLRQGNANEFSKKSAKDRKDILATILGLNQYEIIRKRALEKIRTATNEKQLLIALQEKMATELTTKETIATQMLSVEHTLQELVHTQTTHTNHRAAIEKKISDIAKKEQAAELIRLKIEQLNLDATKQKSTLTDYVHQWRTIHKQQRALPDQTALDTAKQQLIQTIDMHQQTLQKQLELKEQYLKCKETVQTLEHQWHAQQAQALQQQQIARERALSEKNHTEKKLLELQKQHALYTQQVTSTTKQIEQIIAEKKQYTIAIATLATQEKQFERRKEHYQQYVAQVAVLTTELTGLEQKIDLTSNELDPSCPLCEQNLSASRRRFLKQQFITTHATVTRKKMRLVATVKQLKEILITQHAHITHLKKEQTALHNCENSLVHANAQLQKTNTAIADMHKQITDLSELILNVTHTIQTMDADIERTYTESKDAIQKYAPYVSAHKNLQDIIETSKKIIYDQAAHKQAQAALQALEKQLYEYTSIKKEIAQQDLRKESIHHLCVQLKTIKNNILTLTAEYTTYAHLHTEKQQYEHEHAQIKSIIEATQQTKEQLLQQKGNLQSQQEKLHRIEKELATSKATLHNLTSIIDDYQAISAATSKDGIQALLIEDTIPELEHEANQLLAKLTNNQAQLFIESLRDLKNGGTKETLDIKISDTMGIRPYELFSGGEAFRIDFALRIAISKLLARRAGTSLQTLIIDEGFGSQDEQGLSNIMDAIYKIQDDFSKVIIVSHLASMKDQFPVHFVVEKGSNGSHVTIFEQG